MGFLHWLKSVETSRPIHAAHPAQILRTLAQDLKLAQTESIEEADEQPPAVDERDAGVSDEIWAELQHAKEAP